MSHVRKDRDPAVLATFTPQMKVAIVAWLGKRLGEAKNELVAAVARAIICDRGEEGPHLVAVKAKVQAIKWLLALAEAQTPEEPYGGSSLPRETP